MVVTRIRDRKAAETRARIADAAFALFSQLGYTETTFDQIATAAQVGRRTIFHHFPTKESILFADFVARRTWAAERLAERPADEPPIVSLHAVLRELSRRTPDRERLTQLRRIVATDPALVGEQLTVVVTAFETDLIHTLQARPGNTLSNYQLRALTIMAIGWLDAATRAYFTEGHRSLASYYDEIVAISLDAANDLTVGGSAR